MAQSYRLDTVIGPLDTIQVQIEQLEAGDHIVSDLTEHGRLVYRVTADCQSNSRGWLQVLDLTAPEDEDAEGIIASTDTDGPLNYVFDTAANRAALGRV